MSRAQPVTAPVRVSWPSWLWLRVSWPVARRLPPVRAPLLRLGFIHFAHWALVTRVPARGGRRLPKPVLLFLSNFNGPLDPYIDAFAYRVGRNLSGMYWGAQGWPGPLPAAPFRRYVTGHAVEEGHFFCAYPDGSARMVEKALELERRWAAFAPQARGLPPAALETAWRRFVTEAQDLL